MSDPIVHTISTHPCAQCAGPRQVAEMDWRSPRFWVTCLGCGQGAPGETLEAAVETWDASNPLREVSDQEALALQMTLLHGSLPVGFLPALRQAVMVFEATEETQDLPTFLDWCGTVAG